MTGKYMLLQTDTYHMGQYNNTEKRSNLLTFILTIIQVKSIDLENLLCVVK